MSLACAAALSAGAARAEGEAAPAPRPSDFQLEVGAEAAMARLPATVTGPGLVVNGQVGIAPRWSVGVAGRVAGFPVYELDSSQFGPGPFVPGPLQTSVLARVDAEARFHPVLARYLDLWLGPQGGVALAFFEGGSKSAGPHLALGAGADFHPLPALSIGLHASGGAYVLSIPNDGAAIRPGANFGLVIGFHAPASTPARATARAAQRGDM